VSRLKRKVLTLRDGDEVWKLKAKRRSEKEPLLDSYSYRRCNSMMTHINLSCGCGIIVDNVSF
jgi:ribosomal protein S19E (S16A)